MSLRKPKLPPALRRRPVVARAERPADAAAPTAVREPEDDGRAPEQPAEPGWRASSYDLKRGLDVVELPTSLPADVLDRLFNTPR